MPRASCEGRREQRECEGECAIREQQRSARLLPTATHAARPPPAVRPLPPCVPSFGLAGAYLVGWLVLRWCAPIFAPPPKRRGKSQRPRETSDRRTDTREKEEREEQPTPGRTRGHADRMVWPGLPWPVAGGSFARWLALGLRFFSQCSLWPIRCPVGTNRATGGRPADNQGERPGRAWGGRAGIGWSRGVESRWASPRGLDAAADTLIC